jgi:hypothetical protein
MMKIVMAKKNIHILIFAFVALYWTDAVLVQKITHLKDVDMVPDDSYRTDVLLDIPLFSQCLLECSKRDDCLTVLYEDGNCYLFNTNIGNRPKMSGERIATVNETTSLTGKSGYIRRCFMFHFASLPSIGLANISFYLNNTLM